MEQPLFLNETEWVLKEKRDGFEGKMANCKRDDVENCEIGLGLGIPNR